MFNGIIQTILVAFSMKTSRTCTGMLSSENDDFKFLKTTKNIELKKKSKAKPNMILVCLFDLILYVPSTIFQLYRDGSSWVEPVLS